MDYQTDAIRRDNSTKFAFSQCNYCPQLHFKELEDFTRHLREEHCTVEGGSYVCRYGYNAVCNSLPVEGVSDSDYVKHIYKRHVQMDGSVSRTGLGAMSRKLSSSSQHSSCSDPSSSWTIYSASQNLAAVLNDPNRGKQKDFFTKTWGVDFVEKTQSEIPNHPYLPQVNHKHFENYLKKISKRHTKHQQTGEDAPHETPQEILQLFPKVRMQRALTLDKRTVVEKPFIPEIFLQSEFEISQPETFYTVFPFAKDGIRAGHGGSNFQQSGKLLQEKLTHELDHVEVLIAEQVAHKSEAFFEAMTFNDSLMEQLGSTLQVVRALRDRIAVMEKSLAKRPLAILQLARRRCNHVMVLQKLKLMCTVHQTQPTIQVVLSTPDYVNAQELIFTSQELLNHELQGVHSFRHLGSQLSGISELILKMMEHELEGYVTRDLNRPLSNDADLLEPDKLLSIVLGMLKHGTYTFVEKYRGEAFMTIHTVVKQIVLEALAEHDCASEGQYKVEQAQVLTLEKRLVLLENVCRGLVRLLCRIKAVHDAIRDTVSSCQLEEDGYVSISDAAHGKLTGELTVLLDSVCQAAHNECAKLLAIMAKSGTRNAQQDRISSKEIHRLSKVVETFTAECEALSGKVTTPLWAAFQNLSIEFVSKLHCERKARLCAVLESECWRPSDVPPSLQGLVDRLEGGGDVAVEVEDAAPGQDGLVVGGQKQAVVRAGVVLVQTVTEYSCVARDLSWLGAHVLRQLGELLEVYNSKSCQLVLGARALESAKLKTITTTNLALCSRALQLVLWLLPHVRKHFQGLKSPPDSGALSKVEDDMRDHVMQLHAKVVLIGSSAVKSEVDSWRVKPPVPSVSFKNISKFLTKLHEAVSEVLPPDQVRQLYAAIHNAFKAALREQLKKLKIVKNGGPQHGVVTSELIFYFDLLKKLKVLPVELSEQSMDDIWDTG